MSKEEVINCVNLMRQDGLLADSMDMSAYIQATDTENKSALVLDRFSKLEQFLLRQLAEEGIEISLKELNERALAEGITTSSVKNLRTLLYFLTIKSYMRKSESGFHRLCGSFRPWILLNFWKSSTSGQSCAALFWGCFIKS